VDTHMSATRIRGHTHACHTYAIRIDDMDTHMVTTLYPLVQFARMPVADTNVPVRVQVHKPRQRHPSCSPCPPELLKGEFRRVAGSHTHICTLSGPT